MKHNIIQSNISEWIKFDFVLLLINKILNKNKMDQQPKPQPGDANHMRIRHRWAEALKKEAVSSRSEIGGRDGNLPLIKTSKPQGSSRKAHFGSYIGLRSGTG